ncbi:MAG: hypothetical protein NC301_05725 [Bacteroides sp.]|nr:hypothetical protein [Bacteroides sp.]MCM1379228.1 hypothetical protein [Bacteroides sp.]MCM1445114.1 hypothetical protein [Prevotella sp.]
MKKFLFSLLLSVFIPLFSCSEQEMPASVQEADRRGRADARALCQANYTADRELHAALLAVKSREFEMRLSGDSLGATAYIEAFKEQLRETDRPLADKVL